MKRKKKIRNVKKFYCLLYSLSLIFFALSFAFAENSATIVAKANKLYKAKKYDEALALYQEALKADSDSVVINFNIGAAQFKKKNYSSAISSLEKAALSRDKAWEAKTNYNIGNAKYKLGKQKEAASPSKTAALLREALDYYKRAIELNNKNKAAKVNHELVEKELKALLDKLKQQKDSEGKGQKQEGRQGEAQEKEEGSAGEPLGKQAGEEPQEKDVGEEREDAQTQNEGWTQEEAKEMSDKEALMLLEGYRYEEDAQGRIQDIHRGYIGEVDKDW